MTFPVSLTQAKMHLHRRMLRQFSTGQRCGGTPFWAGPPGLGKSAVQIAVAKDVAAQLGKSVLIVPITLADIEVPDVKGMALPAKNPETGALDRIVYTQSGMMPFPEEIDEYDLVVLQLDELPAATMDHTKAVASLLLEYRIGRRYYDPGKYYVMCNGNEPKHKSGAARLAAHIINRLSVEIVEPDVVPWLEWSSDPRNGISPLARAFVDMRPAVFTEGKIPDEPNAPFATLRSLTLGVQDLAATFSTEPADRVPDVTKTSALDGAFAPDNRGVATAFLSGYIGEGAATEFMRFGEVRKYLTPLQEIIADPEEARIPEDTGAMFAMASYIISWVDKDNCEALLTYAMRMRKDMVVSTIAAMRDRCPAIMRLKVFSAFAAENHGLLIATRRAGGSV